MPVEMEHESATDPANPLTGETVMVSVLAVAAPEIKESDDDEAVSINDEAVSVAVTGASGAAVMEPDTPPMVRLNVPLVPGVDTRVTVETAALVVELIVTGVALHEPDAVPLLFAAAQLTVTVPRNPLTGETVTASVLPAVAPETRLREAGETERVIAGMGVVTTVVDAM